MGLLDALLSGGNSGGGLLDFLRSNAMGQQMGQGLQSDQAQYPQQQPMNSFAQMQPNAQPSPLDSAQWPAGPIGAPSQANAQMIPQQPPPVIGAQPMQPAQLQGNPGGLGAGLSGFISNLHTGPIGALAGGIAGAAGLQDPATKLKQQAQNLTLQALIQKGVDPTTAQAAIGNPELLKTLITQAYGPQTVQSLGEGYVYNPKTGKTERAYEPTKSVQSLGEGYVWDAKQGKAVRAYTPEDKTPTSALEYKFYKDNLPEGENAVSFQQWLRTKDKDPNAPQVLGREGVLFHVGPDNKPVIDYKNTSASGDTATIDDKTAKLLAERVLMGDTKALIGLGRGAQGAANILKIHQTASDIAEEKGLDAKGILNNVAQQAGLVSATRAMGTKEAHFGTAEKAMEESLPLARAASAALPRTDWLHLNKLIQLGQTEHSNPLMKKALIATDTAAKDYARTINPSGTLRESDILYARKILSTADGPEAYNAALDQLQLEAGVMHRAIQRQKAELRGDKAGAAQSHEAPAGKTSTGVSWGFVK